MCVCVLLIGCAEHPGQVPGGRFSAKNTVLRCRQRVLGKEIQRVEKIALLKLHKNCEESGRLHFRCWTTRVARRGGERQHSTLVDAPSTWKAKRIAYELEGFCRIQRAMYGRKVWESL